MQTTQPVLSVARRSLGRATVPNHRRCRHREQPDSPFQYACKRFALWRANYRYAQEVKASNGIVLKEPGSVAFSRDGDLVVGDVKDDVDWTEAVGGDVRAAIEQRKKIPGRAVVLGAPSYKVTCVIILRAEPVPPLPPPPLKGCDDSYDPRIAKDNDVCVAGAIGGAAPSGDVLGRGRGRDWSGEAAATRCGLPR